MKILLTGGAGYIGTELTHELLKNPEVQEVIIYDNLSRKNFNLFIGRNHLPDHRVRFIMGDILDSYKLRKVINEVDVVYHLAAKVLTTFSNDDPHLFEQVNHWGTAELSYALEQSPVKKVIYLSSASVYGDASVPMDENTEPQPRTYYGLSKHNGEKMIARLSDRLQTYIIRCGNVYGYSRSLRFDSVINKFMFDAHYTNRITVQGSGKQQRAFVHIQKVSQDLANILTHELASGTYNLVDKNLSVNELADTMKEIYPDLEMLFILQDRKSRTLFLNPDSRLEAISTYRPKTIAEELIAFSHHFAFVPSGFYK
ncbi:NAD-dependent epimerase/dehydratase family protein [Adhaeribacter pallidiroseus]|uniref:UDP-glucose 4-epimerase n=1 Tax=Adhaeribacter pallidiroseus TaxID=2072847 RepID=A0A369QI21_9BACT|nr:SDR family oxidoreductase [Adhaeribacter pallidiroseus]RDC64072.1 UDP-glucose 4-epimerase [Adhaeribacter pallidiroseus]